MVSNSSFSTVRVWCAWAVHGFTASGAVCGLLALDATARGDIRAALLWLGVAFVVDGVDGTLARAVHVQAVLPHVDGRMLDYVIDFLNMVFVPAYIVWVARLLPSGPVRSVAAVTILVVSCFHYANRRAVEVDAVSGNRYFRGFPAMWSLVVFLLFACGLPPWVNAGLVAAVAVAHFVPLRVRLSDPDGDASVAGT